MDERELEYRQYELMVKSAMDVTSWRQTANGFFLTIDTALVTIGAYFSASAVPASILTGIIGLIVSILWYKTIEYYALLNKSKFKVIHEIEKSLPIGVFRKEYEFLKEENCTHVTSLEEIVTILFAILNLALLLGVVASYVT